MSSKMIGDIAIWGEASKSEGGYFPILGIRRGEERSLYAVLRAVAYSTIEEAHKVAVDAVGAAASISAENVISLEGGQTFQAA